MNIEIKDKINEFIVSSILKQPTRILNIDEPLITSGLIDSFSLVDLAVFVEDEIGILIDDSELNSSTFDTLGQLVDLISTRINE
ncbi:acyl carrier protein [Chloroflexota bacterium]